MFSDPSVVSLQFILMLIGGCLVIFSTAAFAIIGAFLMGEGKWYITTVVLVMTAIILWTLVQHTLGINLRPSAGYFGG